MTDEIDIRRPMVSILTCPTCGLVRHLPINWRELMNTETLTCVEDSIAMKEEVVFGE